MNANEYQAWTSETAVYPHSGLGDIVAINYVTTALGGEVGEILNKFKKVLRGDPDAVDGNYLSATKERQIYEEFVGAMYYAARLAEELGVQLEDVMQDSHDLLMGRKERGTIQGDGDDR
jgi:hypothetical protein